MRGSFAEPINRIRYDAVAMGFPQRHSREGGNPFLTLEQVLSLGPRPRGDDAAETLASVWLGFNCRTYDKPQTPALEGHS